MRQIEFLLVLLERSMVVTSKFTVLQFRTHFQGSEDDTLLRRKRQSDDGGNNENVEFIERSIMITVLHPKD